MFPGPTGTNAVEAALKLARKVTGRNHVVSFTNGFHGMTLGALSLTGNAGKRKGAGIPLEHVSHMPYDGYLGEAVDTVEVLRRYLEDSSSGMEKPAAFILETIQGEGGVQVASSQWLRDLQALARQHEILLIIDDIQVGCGRTGTFFSFEKMGIEPDIITLSKSLSGFGLPFAITLLKPELDVWNPGEHNGTFLTATAALEFWVDNKLTEEVAHKGELLREGLERIATRFPELELAIRGKGLIWGLDFGDSDLAGRISKLAFEKGLVIETSGSRDQVLKMLPPLTIEPAQLKAGIEIISQSLLELCVEDTEQVEALAGV